MIELEVKDKVKVVKLLNKGNPAVKTTGMEGTIANIGRCLSDGRNIEVTLGEVYNKVNCFYYAEELELADREVMAGRILKAVINKVPMRVVSWDKGIYLKFKNGLFQNNLGVVIGNITLRDILMQGSKWEVYKPEPKFRKGNIVHNKKGDIGIIDEIETVVPITYSVRFNINDDWKMVSEGELTLILA